ncbi:hypothetical protein GCM10009601_57150 [Streptomyces thermospinosisporus]|uniref:Uncharacterized protein n=1 Tax=Streptomyces thermospinosisporus TaxID=161482 RepID=A0ABP4JWW4_9ACTN
MTRSRAEAAGPSGSTTVSRICIAVSGPFCAGAEKPPTPHEHVGQYCPASSHLTPTTRPPLRNK